MARERQPVDSIRVAQTKHTGLHAVDVVVQLYRVLHSESGPLIFQHTVDGTHILLLFNCINIFAETIPNYFQSNWITKLFCRH